VTIPDESVKLMKMIKDRSGMRIDEF